MQLRPNNSGLAPMVADAMQPAPYLPCGGSDYSATSLIQSPRELQLKKRHKHEYAATKDIKDDWVLFIGNAVHSAIEKELEKKYPTRYMVERKITRHDMGRRVVAKFDAHDVERGVLADHKTTRIGNRRGSPELWEEMKPEHKKQLMLNAFFLMKEGYEVKELAINNTFLDWQPGVAKFCKADVYPQAPSIEITEPCPSFEECEAYYFERLNAHIAAENIPDDALPQCTPEECWQSETVWAIENKATGRSRKNCSTRKEAEEFFADKLTPTTRKTHHIVERKGTRTKCDMFCDAAPYCNQYAEYLKEQLEK